MSVSILSYVISNLCLFLSHPVSVSGKKGVGIPIILLHDAEGGIITVELKNGESYRGLLDESQDTMNCTMKVSHLVPTHTN